MATKTTPKKTTASKSAGTKSAKGTSSSRSTKNTNTSGSGSRSAGTKRRTAAKADLPILRRAKSAGWMAIFESLVIGLLGILLITNSNTMVKLIFYVVGIFLIIKGVYKIINYFAVHGKYDFYNNDLLYGIVALVFGVIAVVMWEQLGGVIGIVVGAWMIYGSLVRMNTAVKMHAAGIKEWFYVLLLSMVMMALGIYMIISVGIVIAVIGWMMVAAAVIGILDDVIFIRHLDAVTQK